MKPDLVYDVAIPAVGYVCTRAAALAVLVCLAPGVLAIAALHWLDERTGQR